MDSGRCCECIYVSDLVHRRRYKFASCLPLEQCSTHLNVPLVWAVFLSWKQIWSEILAHQNNSCKMNGRSYWSLFFMNSYTVINDSDLKNPTLCGLLGENMQVQIWDQQLVQTTLLIKVQKWTSGPWTQEDAKSSCGPSPAHDILTQPTGTSVLFPSTPNSSSVTHTTSHIWWQCFQDKLRGSMSKPVSLAAGLTALLWHS